MLSRNTVIVWIALLVCGALTLGGCDQGGTTQNSPKPATTKTDAHDHAGHDHADHEDDTAAAFTLADLTGAKHSLADYKGKWVVLEWVNHGCPFVKKFYDSGKMQEYQKTWTDKGVVWLTICSSTEGKQGYHTAEEWARIAEEKAMKSSAILLDTDGAVGKAYDAKTTPHMYVINPEGKLVYHGAIDDKPSTEAASLDGAKNYVSLALEAGMAGKPIETESTQAYGCSVKY